MDDTAVRLRALELAISWANGFGATSDEIVQIAQVFYAYLISK
jgi:hypothetical protein